MIALTRKGDGKKVYVNPEQICAIFQKQDEEATIIQFPGSGLNFIMVLESVETVYSLIDRWMGYYKCYSVYD